MKERSEAIGEAAGKIFRALETKGATPSATLQKASEVSESALYHQALGWLARENKVRFVQSGKSVKVALA